MTKAIDLFVDLCVFLDERVRDWHVRFGLVVVVVRDEVVDDIVREITFELLCKLGGEGFVVCDHECGLLNLLNDVGHRKCLASCSRT